jgi:hypothetical protein
VKVYKTSETSIHFTWWPFFLFWNTKYINCSRYDFINN